MPRYRRIDKTISAAALSLSLSLSSPTGSELTSAAVLHSHASCQSLSMSLVSSHSPQAFLPSGLLFVNYVHSLMSWASSCKPNLRLFRANTELVRSILLIIWQKPNKTPKECTHVRLRDEARLTSCTYAFKARVRSFTA